MSYYYRTEITSSIAPLRSTMPYFPRPRVRLQDTPYWWIQDRLVSTCYRENFRDIQKAQFILNNLAQKYNYRIVHSTTAEIPYIKFQRAIKEKKSLFRKIRICPSFRSTKGIFDLKIDRMVNTYRKVSINHLELKAPGTSLYERIQLRIISEQRICYIWSKILA